MADIKVIVKEIVQLGGGGGGAVIDDNSISTTTTWSSAKIDSELSTKAPSIHTHQISDVNNLQSTLDSKVDKPSTATSGNIAVFDANKNVVDSGNTPSDFASANHQHTVADITDYDTTTDNKISTAISTHDTDTTAHSDIRNSLNNKIDKPLTATTNNIAIFDANKNVVDGGKSLSDFALVNHNHAIIDLTDVSISTPNTGDILKYNSTTSKWENVSFSHQHTTSDITDFNTAVDNKISTHNADTTAHSDIRNQLTNKVDKLTTFTQGNVVILDASGGIADSGKSTSDFAPSVHTHTTTDITDYATETDTRISNAISTHNTDATAHNDIRTAVANKVDKSGDLMSGVLTIENNTNPAFKSSYQLTGGNTICSFSAFGYHYLNPRATFYISSTGGDSISNAFMWIIPETPSDVSKTVGIELKTKKANTVDAKRLSIRQESTVARITTSDTDGTVGGTDIIFSAGIVNTVQLALKTNNRVGVLTDIPYSNFEVNGSFGISKGVLVTSNYTVQNDYLILADASAGNITITLPDPTLIQGRIHVIKKIDNTVNIVSITTPVGTIDGVSSLNLTVQNEYKKLIAFNGNYYVIGG